MHILSFSITAFDAEAVVTLPLSDGSACISYLGLVLMFAVSLWNVSSFLVFLLCQNFCWKAHILCRHLLTRPTRAEGCPVWVHRERCQQWGRGISALIPDALLDGSLWTVRPERNCGAEDSLALADSVQLFSKE